MPTYSRLQRLGLCLEPLPPPPRIWLHCASVGEVRAARPLIEGLLARFPHYSLLLTTMTATGAQQALALIAEQGATDQPRLAHRFLPLISLGAAKRFVARVQPELAILSEIELWPSALCPPPAGSAGGSGQRQAIARAFADQRLRPPMESAFANVTWLAAKSSQDAERFQALGCAPSTTSVVGSLKFEQPLPTKALKESECLLQAWDGRPVWVAGSTREGRGATAVGTPSTA